MEKNVFVGEIIEYLNKNDIQDISENQLEFIKSILSPDTLKNLTTTLPNDMDFGKFFRSKIISIQE